LVALLDPDELVVADQLLYGLKRFLSEWDVRGLENAVSVADSGLHAFAKLAREGMTEWEAAAHIERELRTQGVLSTLVHVSSTPFYGQAPTRRQINLGDLVTVLVELTSWDGYWVEIGACFSCGKKTDTMSEITSNCIRCLEESASVLRPQMTGEGVARELEQRISDAGGRRVFGLGHGVGIDEGPPIIATSIEDEISGSTAIAIHPSIAMSGFAVAVANTFMIDSESTRPLSHYPYEVHTFR
jgi:Xaa-Pro aminopeptidase